MVMWQLILIQAVTFVFIVLFLRWLLRNHIGRALKRLQKLTQENLEKRKALKEELEMAKREVEREIERGRQEAENIKAQAQKEAERNREDMLIKVKKEAKRLINEAVKDAQRKKVELTLEMRGRAVKLAVDMVKRILTEQGRKNLGIQLIDELIAEIENLEGGKIIAEGNQAEVICPFALPVKQKKRLKEALSSKLNKDILLAEKIDKEIIAGLIIKLREFIIDGSIKNKLKKILLTVKDEENS